MIKKLLSSITSVALVVLTSATLFTPNLAMAATITSLSDTLSTVKASTAANHTILFASPTGVAAGQTIVMTFTGFTGMSSILFSDVDFATGNSSTCSSATYTEQTLAGSPSGTTWGISSGASTITITSGTGTSAAGNCMRIKIGTNATNQTTGVNQLSNGTAGTATIAFSGTFSDVGTLAVPIIANDVVTVSATVNPTITFSLGSNSVSLGTLTSSSVTTGNHTISASTNGAGGFALSYNGTTLTSGLNTIAAAGATAVSSTPGSPQYGINLGTAPTTNSGTCTADTQYNTTGKYAFVPSTSTVVTAETAPADCQFTVIYGANIATTTPAGSYVSTVNWLNTSTY